MRYQQLRSEAEHERADPRGTPLAPRGSEVRGMRPIYEEAPARFPEIYEACGFVPWLQFLEETQLISWHGCNVVLTPDGHAFLKFRLVTDATVEA